MAQSGPPADEDPTRKDLRWQLKIGDDILDDTIREREFINWIKHIIKAPAAE